MVSKVWRFSFLVFLLSYTPTATLADKLSTRYELIALGNTSLRQENSDLTLVQFWASWCRSCSGLMWDLDKLIDGTKTNYMAVSIDENISDAKNYVQKHGLAGKRVNRFWFDRHRKLAEAFFVNTVPAIVIFNTEGEVLYNNRGHLSGADLLEIKLVLTSPENPLIAPARSRSQAPLGSVCLGSSASCEVFP